MCFGGTKDRPTLGSILKDTVESQQAIRASASAGAPTEQGQKKRGRKGTIITRGLGLGSVAETSTKTLLGA